MNDKVVIYHVEGVYWHTYENQVTYTSDKEPEKGLKIIEITHDEFENLILEGKINF